jgi:hypothetical protein
MFRRLMILMAALAVAAAGWSLPAQAAPVSGSATLDIVFQPPGRISTNVVQESRARLTRSW